MTALLRLLALVARDLDALGAPWALVGGLAVGVRVRPRFTQDIDLAVAVGSDREAERLVAELRRRGYALDSVVEQEAVARLSIARLLPGGRGCGASSWICSSLPAASRARSRRAPSGWRSRGT
ncbi:MAG: nucleotidyl transferase AbiEii/AbiGii toxin family protein [Thermoanaerobaculia bacterium]|nr:nucleotidyl transferase AbiEii/AbiGii toxin family protein [Thermoanaerobaculia bacterium]